MHATNYTLQDSLSGKGTFRYFAYGSNLLAERLKLKNPSAVFFSVGKLEDYSLTFMRKKIKPTTRWKGAGATIVESPGDHVWGVIWQLSIADIESLDKQESEYKSFAVGVKDPEGNVHVCRTYAMVSDIFEVDLPSPQYMDVIQKGAKQNYLPHQYQEYLSQIQHNGNEELVETYEAIIKLIDGGVSI